MLVRTAVWKVATPPEPLAETSLPNERVLEEMIVADLAWIRQILR